MTPDAPTLPEIRGEDDPRTLQAIEEGRRLEHMNMSTDPYSGRNPSYCFVELTTKSQADDAMQELSGKTVLGRPVKLGPGVAAPRKRTATDRTSRGGYSHTPVFQRWTRTDAPDHFKGYGPQGRRVKVGGLPMMGTHSAVNAGIRELFAGFEIEAVSKVVIPFKPAFPGDPKALNHRHLFVDFPSADEAKRAAKATDGRYAWDVKLSVQVATWADSPKARERGEWYEENSDLQNPELPCT
ncbi:MAG: hypothetical protein Q9224_005473 [Gallowayella concinna]